MRQVCELACSLQLHCSAITAEAEAAKQEVDAKYATTISVLENVRLFSVQQKRSEALADRIAQRSGYSEEVEEVQAGIAMNDQALANVMDLGLDALNELKEVRLKTDQNYNGSRDYSSFSKVLGLTCMQMLHDAKAAVDGAKEREAAISAGAFQTRDRVLVELADDTAAQDPGAAVEDGGLAGR